MPHAERIKDAQDAADEVLIQQALSLDPQNPLDLSRDLEVGEKAEGAIDFEDLSDDDLPDEDDNGAVSTRDVVHVKDTFATPLGGSGPLDDTHVVADIDDLFGDDNVLNTDAGATIDPLVPRESLNEPSMPLKTIDPPSSASTEALDQQTQKEQQMQQELFALSRASFATENLPVPPANNEELLNALWPKFERHDVPRFMDLLPPKKARYAARQIPKPPRMLNPTKITLELDMDQEKAFKLSQEHRKRTWQELQKPNLISFPADASSRSDSDSETDNESDTNSPTIHGVSLQDMQMLCVDWELSSNPDVSDVEGLSGQSEESQDLHYLSAAATKNNKSRSSLTKNVRSPGILK